MQVRHDERSRRPEYCLPLAQAPSAVPPGTPQAITGGDGGRSGNRSEADFAAVSPARRQHPKSTEIQARRRPRPRTSLLRRDILRSRQSTSCTPQGRPKRTVTAYRAASAELQAVVLRRSADRTLQTGVGRALNGRARGSPTYRRRDQAFRQRGGEQRGGRDLAAKSSRSGVAVDQDSC